MVNSLGSLSGVILMFALTLHYGSIIGYFSSSGITWVCASGVACLIVPIFIFGVFILLGAPVETSLGGFFTGCTCSVHTCAYFFTKSLYPKIFLAVSH